MRTSTLAVLLLFAGCAPRTSGPRVPFDGVGRPRIPEHYLVGNSFDLPLRYEVLQSFAVGAGTPGMAGLDAEAWTRAGGTVRVEEREGRTQFSLTLSGLVPGGLYTAWLVRVAGSGRGDKRDLALGTAYAGDIDGDVTGNAFLALADGTATHQVTLGPTDADPTGLAYGDVELWDEIHVAFHADARAYGPSPGPMHWTQVILPIHPDDGSAHVTLAPALDDPALDQPGTAEQLVAALRARGLALGDEWPGGLSMARGAFSLSFAPRGSSREWWVMASFDGSVPGARHSLWWVRGDERCPLGGPDGLFASQVVADARGRGTVRAGLTPASSCSSGPLGEALGEGRVELLIHTDADADGLTRPAGSWVLLAAPFDLR